MTAHLVENTENAPTTRTVESPFQDEVAAALAAFAALPGWLAAGMDGALVGRQLEARVPELAAGALRLVSCVPERLRAKEDEWLARYRVSVAAPEGDPWDLALVGRLWAPSQPPPAAVESPPGDGVTFPAAGWSCWLPELRLELRVQTSDEALPALPLLVDPAAAAGLLEPILHDAGHPGATIVTCQPEVVRYKPGSRCTVVVRLDYADAPADAPADRPAPPTPVVLKTHQGDKGQTAWAAMTALWERAETWRDAVTMAEPLAYLPDERILVQGPVPEEQTLKVLARTAITNGGQAALGKLRDELAKAALALATVHRSGAVYGRTATFEDELAEVREVVARLSHTVPQLESAAEPLLWRLTERSEQRPADPIVAAHHDFRPAQVLLHGGRVGFIDFDGASMAEPALDLGRFRAKLRDIAVSALVASGQPLAGEPLAANLRLQDDLCDHFLAAYQAQSPVSRARVLLWESCDLLTAMLHAWTKVRLLRLDPRLTVLLHQLHRSGLTVVVGHLA